MRIPPIVLPALLCVFALPACGKTAPRGPVAIGDFASQYADALCDSVLRCGEMTSRAVCLGRFEQDFQFFVSGLVASVQNGSVLYDAVLAGQCLDWERALPCDLSTQTARVPPQACPDAIRGTVAGGGACTNPVQCISGSCSVPPNDPVCVTGVCAPMTAAPAAPGQPCSSGGCVDGSFCNGSGVCTALSVAGTGCVRNDQCTWGTVCAGYYPGPPTCMRAPAEGEACLPGEPGCTAAGLYCDPGTNRCVKLLGAGAACMPVASGCQFDLECFATAVSATCTPLPTVGAACTSGCAPGAFCQAATQGSAASCVATRSAGKPCQGYNECQSGFCSLGSPGTCQPVPVCS